MNGRRLHPTLPHLAGEAPTSLASRLAQLHLTNNASARSFCADMGIDFRRVVDGQPDALTALADLAGADPATLAAEAFRRVPEGHLFRGERLPKSSLLRTSLRFCPACLLDDCSGASKPEVMAYGRTVWSIAAIRTCLCFGVQL
ncbi:TniQ family protein [Methylobacterium sp. E-066]|uniref:TniQ family protein n=1 Tax=Methylobacterium sp. E-066 TaxID=2836584 RepID=UPI001FB8D09E|nr:TniQ family protein [Methylobacterium sp. E-066]MCJ2140069.1 TniQ family protein [Methylobacterium sp. E-066]